MKRPPNKIKFKDDIKILFLDLETMPNIVAAWRCGYKLNIGTDSILQERFILSAQWAWNEEKAVGMLANFKKKDDKKLIKTISKEIAKADIIVGHNIRRFDLPWIEGRAFIHGLPPIGVGYIPHLDTMKMAKATLGLNGYSMNYLSKLIGGLSKTPTHYSDWIQVLTDNDVDKAEHLLKYGIKDVVINRDLFRALLPYSRLTTHMGVLAKGDKYSCPACGGKTVSHGRRVTASGNVQARRRCTKCGNVSHAPAAKE